MLVDDMCLINSKKKEEIEYLIKALRSPRRSKHYSKLFNFERLLNTWSSFFDVVYKGSTTDSILDLGCGGGLCSLVGSSKGYFVENLEAFFSDSGVAEHRKFMDVLDIDCKYYNPEENPVFPFQKNRFDSIVSRLVLGQKKNVPLMEVLRVLKPGGVIYISTMVRAERFLSRDYGKVSLGPDEYLEYKRKDIKFIGWSSKRDGRVYRSGFLDREETE